MMLKILACGLVVTNKKNGSFGGIGYVESISGIIFWIQCKVKVLSRLLHKIAPLKN